MNTLSAKAHLFYLHLVDALKNREAGQGTVEYVGIIIVIAAILLAAVGLASGLGGTITSAITRGFTKALSTLGV